MNDQSIENLVMNIMSGEDWIRIILLAALIVGFIVFMILLSKVDTGGYIGMNDIFPRDLAYEAECERQLEFRRDLEKLQNNDELSY